MFKEQFSINKDINLSNDNIEIPQNHQKTDSKAVIQQNKFIRKQNEILRKQLESISTRLDGQIRKRLQQQKRKQLTKGEDGISQMELQNAYKKCQIYKKEVAFYKKKLDSIGDGDKIIDFQNKLSQYVRQNQQLKDEIKQVKKIIKLQQKGLTENGADGYLKLVAENQKLHQEIRRLKKQIDQSRRDKHKSIKTRTESENLNSPKFQAKIPEKDVKFPQNLKKRIKTQQYAHEELHEVLQQKVEKDYNKIKTLMNEKTKLREMVDNLKLQLVEKQKENSLLRQKISSLRINNQVLLAQLNSKVQNYHSGVEETKSSKIKSQSRNSKSRYNDSVYQKRLKQLNNSEQTQNENISNENMKYPRKQERGSQISKYHNSITWNHQALSSKIKELQVLEHENGHIKNLHVRYQKGQVKKYDNEKGKYRILSCTEGEYIKYMKGCFSDGYLQCIQVTTNNKRQVRFGKWQQFLESQQGEHFEFQVHQNEFPGALFGQNDQNGIRRLGCIIHKQL